MKAKAKQTMIVVWDGMRPDLVGPQNTPNLWEFADGGVTFMDNHACLPTATRLNAASISTGAYPSIHGLMGNTVLVPEIDPTGVQSDRTSTVPTLHPTTIRQLNALPSDQ